MGAALQRRARRRERGTAAIEYALVLPAVLLFVLGLMDTGRLIWSYATLSRAVEAAARCAAVNTTQCGTVGQIKTFAVAEAWGMTIDTTAFTVSTPACGIQVNGSYGFEFVMPGLNVVVPAGTVTLSASACYPT
jgi:Flp pilus assembly protein TadG